MIIRNGKIIPTLNNGNVSLADSYIKKNNKEFYSIQSSELLSNLAYIYERQDDVISIAKKLSIEIDKPSYRICVVEINCLSFLPNGIIISY